MTLMLWAVILAVTLFPLHQKLANKLGGNQGRAATIIVILGILASFAVPKFIGVEREARVAAVNAMAGTLRGAAAMAHGVSMSQGLAPGAAVIVEGKTINMTNSYPNRTTLTDLVQDTSGFAYNNGVFTRNGATTPASCSVSYANATTQTVTLNTTPASTQVQTIAPVITVTVTGC